jgi:hypothetical protein
LDRVVKRSFTSFVLRRSVAGGKSNCRARREKKNEGITRVFRCSRQIRNGAGKGHKKIRGPLKKIDAADGRTSGRNRFALVGRKGLTGRAEGRTAAVVSSYKIALSFNSDSYVVSAGIGHFSGRIFFLIIWYFIPTQQTMQNKNYLILGKILS